MSAPKFRLVAAALFLAWAAVAVPAEAQGRGCFANYETLGGLDNWTAHVELMRACGMNTAAIFYRDANSLAAQIDTMIETGMLDTTLPLLVISNAGPPAMVDALGEQGWADLCAANGGWPAAEIVGAAAVLGAARTRGRYADCWPELVVYGIDEPGHGEGRALNMGYLQSMRDDWRAQGYRIGSACYYPYDFLPARAFDIVIAGIIVGGDARACRDVVRALGREYWTYAIAMENFAPEVLRYHVGAWAWASGARVNLVWDWQRLLGEQADMAQPQSNAWLDAWREGVRDYEWLAQTQARLDALRTGWNGDLVPLDCITGATQAEWRAPYQVGPLLPERGAP